jgi:type IV pilus assembly protein PilQ
MRKNGNVVLVAPRDELATKEKLELEARSQIAELEPLRTENFVVNYQKVDDVRKLLVDDKQRLLSKRGSVVVDSRTNQMFVQDTTARLEDVRRLLARIDIPVPQVLIESRIVEADETFSRNLGVRLGGTSGYPRHVVGGIYGSVGGVNGATSGTGTGGTVTIGGTTVGAGGATSPSVSTSTNFVNLPASNLNGFDAAGVSMTLFNASLSSVLNLEISALEADGRGKIVSSPRVVTADKVKAVIEQGSEIPYQSASAGSGIGTVQFRKAVLKLDVTPLITPEGGVFLDVKVNKDSPGQNTTAGPAINTKAVQTQVLVENGGTVVLGGIYEQTETNTRTQVPFLGDLPFVGNLFRSNSRVSNRTELMIFITPKVLSSGLPSVR